MKIAIGWIDSIHNNTDTLFEMRSVGGDHHGEMTDKDTARKFKMDDQSWQEFEPGHRWHADWCGIQWYSNDNNYKGLRVGGGQRGKMEIHFFQSNEGGKNWVMFVDGRAGRILARQQVPTADYHCILRVENEKLGSNSDPDTDIKDVDRVKSVLGRNDLHEDSVVKKVFLDVVNDNGNVQKAERYIYDQTKDWAKITASALPTIPPCHSSCRLNTSVVLGALRNDSGSIQQRIQRTGGGSAAPA